MAIIIVLFSSASRTLHWHIERGEGRTFFLLAWFIQSLIVELIHGIPGGYTHGFGFTALFSGTYRTVVKLGGETPVYCSVSDRTRWGIHGRMSIIGTSGLNWLCVVS
jgi:hypothetical protein